jgi:cyanophycinase-like exopeptidase
MILSSFTAEDEAFVREADLILLAGGEVGRGWRVFCEVGLRELIIERYYEGAVLLGVSAGAVQLGLCGPVEVDGQVVSVTETFGLVPFVIGAHEEARGWRALRETVRLARRRAEGFGIPAGGGAIYYPDGRVEPVGRPLFELSPGEDAGCV